MTYVKKTEYSAQTRTLQENTDKKTGAKILRMNQNHQYNYKFIETFIFKSGPGHDKVTYLVLQREDAQQGGGQVTEG